MLIDLATDPTGLKRVSTGLYVMTSWEGHMFGHETTEFYEWDFEWPEYLVDDGLSVLMKELDSGTHVQIYGSCDSPEQFLLTREAGIIRDRESSFIVTFIPMRKCDEQDGGYRWHKNGPYIGTHELLGYEYFKDEPNVEEIYQFHVYRKKGT